MICSSQHGSWTAVGMALAVMVISPAANAQTASTDFETLAAELAKLRSEVETMSQEIEDIKEETRSKLRTMASQETSMEAEIQREELRYKQIQQAMEKVQERVRAAGQMQRDLKPAVLAAASAIKSPIRKGLPFKTGERISDLEALEKDVKEDVLAPTTAVARLWSRVEDELRLGRENGMYSQIISLEGEEVLADVGRVGMVMMYFRTQDGRFGYAKRDGSGTWIYEAYVQPEDKERAAAFFDSLEKRIRVGFFELPYGVPAEGGAQ